MPRTISSLALALVLALLSADAQTRNATVTVDANSSSTAFPHFWEQMFGSGRAILSLRDSYRQDLRQVKQATGFQYIRFHAIFDDDVGVYSEDSKGAAIYNFSYVDQIYDGLLANGVKPFVELSFMPRQLASAPTQQAFWYHPYVAPPKDWQKWDALISAFAQHLIDRYGVDEVATWYFEVWNEPNLDFWAGKPPQSTYWQLYDHTAAALKKVSPRLRVGGPATAQAAWVPEFLRHCSEHHIPVDFVSTHVYANDPPKAVFGSDEEIPRNQFVCRAVGKVHDEIQHSSTPALPLIWSEFNASYKNERDVTDALYMGPWLADTVRQCDGLVDMMSYWTFSDVFEEQGVIKTPFYGGFGLIAQDGIPKPSFNAFKLLHKLGNQRLRLDSDSALATRNSDGSLVLALWNYAAPDAAGQPESLTVDLKNTNAQSAEIWRLDADHGDSNRADRQMGDPRYPTPEQIRQLRASAELDTPETRPISNHQLVLNIPPHGLVVVELK
jgi:xylan 1,4-beta-xylosidase